MTSSKLVRMEDVLRVVREHANDEYPGDTADVVKALESIGSPSSAEAPSGALSDLIHHARHEDGCSAGIDPDAYRCKCRLAERTIEASAELAELRKSHEDSIKEALEFNAGWDCATEEAAAEIGEFASMGYAWRHFDELQAKAAERDSAVTEERERCLAICRYYRRRWGHGEMGSACPIIAEAIASGSPALSATADTTEEEKHEA